MATVLSGLLLGCNAELRAQPAPTRPAADTQDASAASRCGGGGALGALDDPEPAWTYESPGFVFYSPREVDLDGDGKLELIIMGGTEVPPDGEVTALDGASGELVWRAPAGRQMYGSPVFIDVNQDGVLDVLIGGRSQEFLALDGTSGELVWRFEDTFDVSRFGFNNFYSAVVIDDVTGDAVSDLLVANGGVDGFEPGAPRPPGHLMVLDARTGDVVAFAETPDEEETYMSALLLPRGGGTSPTVLFGTGGETRRGGLWVTALSDVLAGDIRSATRLVAGDFKGVIAPPSLADFNQDGQLDFAVAVFDGQLIAFDGETFERLWEVSFDDSESYTTPTLGYFNDDDVPDLFVVFLRGQFPDYESARYALLDGHNGALLWQEEHGQFTQAGDLAVDLDGDGKDEVLFLSNDRTQHPERRQRLHLLDTARRAARPWGPPLGGVLGASPWTGDLDADGCLDLVVPRLRLEDEGRTALLTRYRLPAAVPPVVRWGGYLGTRFDSVITPPP